MAEFLFTSKWFSLNPNVDDATLGWVWQGGGSAAAIVAAGEWITAIGTLYGGHFVESYLSGAYDRTSNRCNLSIYDITGHLDGSAHGGPVHVTPWTAKAAGGNAEPAQLANVVEYQADYGSAVEFGPHTRPRSRLRGRHYWGALDTSAVAVGGSPGFDATVSPLFTATLKGFYSALLGTLTFGPGWSVWSRVSASVQPVTHGWVDGLVHTQRRREDASGVKTTWP